MAKGKASPVNCNKRRGKALPEKLAYHLAFYVTPICVATQSCNNLPEL